MPNFIINNNQQPSGDYEVHNSTTPCSYVSLIKNKTELGFHASCSGAVAEAKRRFPEQAKSINGCFYCCRSCHTT